MEHIGYCTTLDWHQTARPFLFYNQRNTSLPRNFEYCLSYGCFFFVYSILAEQWLINTPPENLKLASRVMIATFHFPIENPDPNKQWNCFVNQINMKTTENFVLFELHFEYHFINRTQVCHPGM